MKKSKKTLHLSIILLMYLFPLGVVFSTENTLRIPAPRSEFDISHDYHKQLLILALKKAANGREIPIIQTTIQFSQGRASSELAKGDLLDVYWFGVNQVKNNDLIAIQVPTTRGLIGYRKFIIRKESVKDFDKITTIDNLKPLIACQGTHWPDTDILNATMLTVTTTTIYENLFKMVNSKRCDYFPRGYHDANTELMLRKHLYPDLVSYEKIILHYPFAVYFFTNKNNLALAKWIEEGMEQLAQNGDIEKLMKAHPLTASIYPLKNEKDILFIDIPNPLLPAETDFNNPVYWILPKDFNITVKPE